MTYTGGMKQARGREVEEAQELQEQKIRAGVEQVEERERACRDALCAQHAQQQASLLESKELLGQQLATTEAEFRLALQVFTSTFKQFKTFLQ